MIFWWLDEMSPSLDEEGHNRQTRADQEKKTEWFELFDAERLIGAHLGARFSSQEAEIPILSNLLVIYEPASWALEQPSDSAVNESIGILVSWAVE